MAKENKEEKINIMNRNPKGSFKCYFCDGLIPDAEMVVMKVPLICKGGKVRNYERKLHAKCSANYAEKRKDVGGSMVETDEWDELYQYVKLLVYRQGVNLPKYFVHRLQGMRTGTFAAKGINRKLLDRGYSYPTILKAFKFSKPTIVNTLQSQHFSDEKHRINMVMYIVNQNIAEIDRRIKNQESASKKLDSAIKSNELGEGREKASYVKQDVNILPTRTFGSSDEDFDSLFD
ncbi:hypothetical protein [Vagococcus fluvialis]|uniref:hypothetical protein n=1 Tax=Vagococcus fluvialis TaxID=2738 RepID=UPI001D0B887C|nr:hypothetical protein [Vagococcus fluvialis]UDM72668.1 hypothetical protein K5L00_14870 [Vagococcus fluvialis]UDM78391.1 hypothetical protein K5K98_15075 [Vagococcus fluvialis]UDM83943.1 hypothetical protein K5K96_14895 [Vagococcus fluvialis]